MAGKKKPQTPGVTPDRIIRSALRAIWLRSAERNAALKRTGYCCSGCGVKRSTRKGQEQKVEVHHLDEINWEGLIEIVRERMLQTPDRLVPLCPDCHKEVHREQD